MKNRAKFSYFALFLMALITGFFMNGWLATLGKKIAIEHAATSANTLLTRILTCPMGENAESYRCTVPLIVAYLKNNDINQLFGLLEQKSRTDEKTAAACHSLGHATGRALFETYGFVDAISKCNPFCADGCSMGVMEKFLSANLKNHVTMTDVVEKANSACEKFAKGNPVKRAACVHGTGHGIMPLVSYDTKSALDLCKEMGSKDLGSCYDAVFMEKFLPSESARKVAVTSNLYEYCTPYESEEEQKYRCFGYLPYAWKDWGKTPSQILELCLTPQVHDVGCARALVRLYIPGFITTHEMTFFDLYKKAPKRLQDPMNEFGSILVIEYNPSKARDFCIHLGKPEQACMQRMESIARTMDIQIP
jgi:hypothetical protein